MPSPGRTVGRLSVYRRLLQDEHEKGVTNVFSHQLASLAGVTAAQIRRDLMHVGCPGNPRLGYSVKVLKEAIEDYLTPAGEEKLALVGVGNLGRAVLDYFAGRHRRVSITAAFDRDPKKAGRVIHGCRCHPMEELPKIVATEGIAAAIIAVPAEQAQEVADELMLAGVTGILNFAPIALRVQRNVHLETNDLTMAIEKVVFFAREKATPGDLAMRARRAK